MGGEGSHFREDEGGIHYREHLSLLARGFVLFMALAMIAMSAMFGFLEDWGEPRWSMLLTVLFVLAPLAVAAVFLRLGLEPAKEASFDARTRTVRMVLRWPLLQRRSEWPFERIRSLVTRRHPSLEDADSFILHMQVDGRARDYLLGVFAREDEADAWRDRIESLLSGGNATV